MLVFVLGTVPTFFVARDVPTHPALKRAYSAQPIDEKLVIRLVRLLAKPPIPGVCVKHPIAPAPRRAL
jgi:hypothetical protein